MATIATILIGVISLLGKWNKSTREVFWWLVAGREHLMVFFLPKKPKMRAGRWCRMKVQKINREVDSVQKIKREVECWVIGGIGEYEE